MRLLLILVIAGSMLVTGCNERSVFKDYVDFENRYWLVNEKPEFRFSIEDTTTTYTLYCNVRNSTRYPYSRIFLNFSLQDTTGKAIETRLLNEFLFEAKTGKPLGKSGLGDLFDHRIPVLKNHKFSRSGAYEVKLEQFMRADTLEGIVSVGLDVEKTQP